MCGFSGFWSSSNLTNPHAILHAMGSAIDYRGPDDEGVYFDASSHVGFVHRRLAIHDISMAAAQPMASHSKRFILVFNGEIYNFQSLRSELIAAGCLFTSDSDTEVLLAGIEYEGLEHFIQRCDGMFAFALLDNKDNCLYLCRDRMGEKPLYYGWQGDSLLFGSDLRAFRQHPHWQGAINEAVIGLYLRHNAVPSPHSIYQDIYKLAAASIIRFSLDTISVKQMPEPKRYWYLENFFETNQHISFHQASLQLEDKLEHVLSEQMLADVPLGAFLSGGIDSSTIVALMQKQSMLPVQTFSVGFDKTDYNEAVHAKAVAKHLGTSHNELYLSSEHALSVIQKIPDIFDEPFADSSQIPTFLVSQMTKQHVTVALSGDGGDELFCGYSRYFSYHQAWLKKSNCINRLMALAVQSPDALILLLMRVLSTDKTQSKHFSLQHRLSHKRNSLTSSSLPQFYQASVSYWHDDFQVLNLIKVLEYGLKISIPETIADDPYKIFMWLDINWYLLDDILVKVDRTSMANSLETRVPFLDRRIVEFALSLPTSFNVEGNIGKQLLRSVLYRHVPRQLVDRPKQGFAVPIKEWLRGPLKDWADSLINDLNKQQTHWDVAKINQCWQAHLCGSGDYSFQLWGLLMYQQWYNAQKVMLR